MTDETRSGPADELRRQAEEKAKADEGSAPNASLSPEAAQRVLHELRVHQIELEMQNEELRRAQAELSASRARYFDLYDFAPVGYVTLSERGLILEANLTAATLLGVARGALVRKPFSHFILPEDQDVFYRHRKQLMEAGTPQVSELRMLRAAAGSFWARIEATTAQDEYGAPECRAAISDITEHKWIEDAQLFLSHSGYPHRDEDFFQSLARYLAGRMAMDFVSIDRVLGDGLAADPVVTYCDGKFKKNLARPLKDTACGNAVGKEICTFAKDVRHLFPRDDVLKKLMAESYVGTTLWGFDGLPVGLISVVGRKPLVNTRLAESLLRLVAARTASELERRRSEDAQQEAGHRKE